MRSTHSYPSNTRELNRALKAPPAGSDYGLRPSQGQSRARVWVALVIAKIVNLYRLYIVDCFICKFYTVIKLSTNYICIVVNADSIW